MYFLKKGNKAKTFYRIYTKLIYDATFRLKEVSVMKKYCTLR